MNAIENTQPGVTAIINAGTVARSFQRQPTSTAFVAGYSDWGPVNTPTVVTSFADFVRQFGKFNANSYLVDAMYAFFNFFPGRQAIISRAVGATPVVATKTLNDRAGTPLATLRVDAKYPSSAVDIKVEVAAGTNANTVKLIFTSAYFGANATETYDNVTLAAADLTLINDKSKLVVLTDLASATSAPNNLPAVAAAAALTGGTDDFDDIGATQYNAAIAAFNDSLLGTGQVACPGITSASVLAALKANAESYQRLAIVDAPFGNDVSTQIAVDDSSWRSAYVWELYLWEKASNFSGADGTRYLPPSIAGLGACAWVDRNVGTHKAPANVAVSYAFDVERNSDGTPILNDASRKTLNDHQICPVGPIGNEGIKIYGARLLYPAGESRVNFVHQRRILNLIYATVQQGLTPYVFEPATEKLFRSITASCQSFLRALWQDGALYGATEKEAFTVVCDASNNPGSELDQGRVHVQIAVHLVGTAEQIIVNIDSVPLSQDLSTFNGGN